MNTLTAITPVFLNAADRFWDSPEGRRVLLKSIQAPMNAAGVTKTFVCTDRPNIVRLAQSLGIESRLIDRCINARQDGILPPGTELSLSFLHDVLRFPDTDVMILDFTNPLITTEIINRAAHEFSRSQRPALVSVVRSIDHPCQLHSYYKIRDVALAHCFDAEHLKSIRVPGEEPYDGYVTKPFYFDWKARGIHQKTGWGMYIRWSEDPITYLPFGNDPVIRARARTAPVWVYNDPLTARLLVHPRPAQRPLPSSPPMPSSIPLRGAAFSYEDSTISALLYRARGGSCHLLFPSPPEAQRGNYVLKASPVGPISPSGNRQIELEISDLSRPISLPWEDENLQGILYCLLEVVNDDTYDLVDTFPCSAGLWHTSGGKTYRSTTGREILGRQNFPPVFELDGSIFIARRDAVNHLEKIISEGRAAAFAMPAHTAIHIKSPLDVLRYRVRTARSFPVSLLLPPEKGSFFPQFPSQWYGGS